MLVLLVTYNTINKREPESSAQDPVQPQVSIQKTVENDQGRTDGMKALTVVVIHAGAKQTVVQIFRPFTSSSLPTKPTVRNV
jgi:hypothetical protein